LLRALPHTSLRSARYAIVPKEKRKALEEIMRSDKRINPCNNNPNQPKGQGREDY